MRQDDVSFIPGREGPSLALIFGSLSLVMWAMGGLVHFSTRGVNLEPSPGLVFALLIYGMLTYVPTFLGAALTLGTLAASFVEGVSNRRSQLGLLLAIAGAVLAWNLWHVSR